MIDETELEILRDESDDIVAVYNKTTQTTVTFYPGIKKLELMDKKQQDILDGPIKVAFYGTRFIGAKKETSGSDSIFNSEMSWDISYMPNGMVEKALFIEGSQREVFTHKDSGVMGNIGENITEITTEDEYKRFFISDYKSTYLCENRIRTIMINIEHRNPYIVRLQNAIKDDDDDEDGDENKIGVSKTPKINKHFFRTLDRYIRKQLHNIGYEWVDNIQINANAKFDDLKFRVVATYSPDEFSLDQVSKDTTSVVTFKNNNFDSVIQSPNEYTKKQQYGDKYESIDIYIEDGVEHKTIVKSDRTTKLNETYENDIKTYDKVTKQQGEDKISRCREYYPNGQISRQEDRINNKIVGDVYEFFEDGVVKAVITKNIHRYFYHSGELEKYIEYEKYLIIKEQIYTEAGILREESIKEENGRRTTEYYFNGVMKRKYWTDHNERIVGQDLKFYANGSPEYIRNYNRNGRLEGIQIYWDVDGKKREEVYKQGVKLSDDAMALILNQERGMKPEELKRGDRI